MSADTLSRINSDVIDCRLCPRLVKWRERVAREKRRAYQDVEYWGRPVPGFGDPRARVLVVGLAPGAHGSNRTGRPFTGDGSGGFLYPALHRAGFANQPTAISRDDGLRLKDLYITSVGRCAPPANKPLPGELDNCQPYLIREIELIHPSVIVCLGQIAFQRMTRLLGLRDLKYKFGHAAAYHIQQPPASGILGAAYWLLCSYHPSQQNTLTGKLTPRMFDAIWTKARSLAAAA